MTTFRPLVQHELDRYLQIMLRVRVAGSVFLVGLGVVFAVWHPVWWKVVSAVTIGMSVGLVGIIALKRSLAEAVEPKRIPWLTGSILLVQIMLVTLTGGIQSPLIIMFPLVNLLLTITHPGRTLRALRTAVLLAAIWGLALADAAGLASSLVLPFLQGETGRGAPPAYGVGLAVFLSIAVAMGAYHAGRLRSAFDRAQRLAIEAQADVIDAERSRSRDLLAMSGTLAHELKNPLASIRGLSVLVTRKQAVGSREREQMEVLGSEAERMGAILEEFLSFSRPTTPLTLEQEVSLERLVRDALTLHQAMAAERRVELALADESTGRCACDPRKIMQILINLLQNAIDASPEGGTVRVQLTPSEAAGTRLEVCDEGPGLSPEVRDRLFRPGFTTKSKGTGLGLTISRMIAEQHGGTLTLADRPSGGCIAVLTLPPSQSPAASTSSRAPCRSVRHPTSRVSAPCSSASRPTTSPRVGPFRRPPASCTTRTAPPRRTSSHRGGEERTALVGRDGSRGAPQAAGEGPRGSVVDGNDADDQFQWLRALVDVSELLVHGGTKRVALVIPSSGELVTSWSGGASAQAARSTRAIDEGIERCTESLSGQALQVAALGAETV